MLFSISIKIIIDQLIYLLLSTKMLFPESHNVKSSLQPLSKFSTVTLYSSLQALHDTVELHLTLLQPLYPGLK